MNKRITTLTLLAALLLGLFALVPKLMELRLPGNDEGFEPNQPIAYSHRLHAGELGIDCQYCHSGARRSRYAGIPSASVCMNCHRFITASRSAVRAEEMLAEEQGREPNRVVSPELAKLYTAFGLGPDLLPDPALEPRPIEWTRIYSLPDFAVFDHRPHVYAGVACQKCHGPVETMERVRQVRSLSMGWCVNCHRSPQGAGVAVAQASIDCSACHY
jgi:hypothetical protein